MRTTRADTHPPCRCVNDRNNNYRFSYALPRSPYCSRAMITDCFHGVKISKSYDYQAFLQPPVSRLPPPRVNCNRGYARAADPCGSFQIRDTPLTRDVDRVMDFHVAVTGMKIACMARLELFFYMVMRTAPLDNCCSLFKSSSRALFL